MEEYDEKPNMWRKMTSFARECMRVFRITRKPTSEEFWNISKVAGIGILVIGLLGFLVHLIKIALT